MNDGAYLGFLDDTSSQIGNSPVKTSTVVKENLKWNENDFFKRQDFIQASESLFIPPAESPICTPNIPTTTKEPQKPKFNLDDYSFTSDKTSSSLGILNVENLSDFNDDSYQLIELTGNPQKSKRKLQRHSRISSEENDSNTENHDIEELYHERFPLEEAEADSNSSSDIEYDGTNIPELNMDCDILSLMNSDKARTSTCNTIDSADESGFVKNSTFTKEGSDVLRSSYSSSQFNKKEFLKSDSAYRENSESKRSSIFENIQFSYESLYDQLKPNEELAEKNKNEKQPKTIRICPFLDVSSFEIEPILQKSDNSISDVENARCNENTSVDFCPEEISARSSSFSSSIKTDYSDPETSSSFSKKHMNLDFTHPKLSTSKEDTLDLGNGVSSGLCFQTPGTMLESSLENSENNESKNSELFAECNNSDVSSTNVSGLGDLPSELYLRPSNFSDFTAGGESWCSRLGLSESDFFSSETAKEMLNKDKEEFEKEQTFQDTSSNKISSASNWSPPSQLEITAPSWFSELDPDHQLGPDRHISIGTLISARSENFGSLSENTGERPFFATEAISPPKLNLSGDSFAAKTSVDSNYEDKSTKTLRVSGLSEIMDEISMTDTAAIAAKIMEKCIPVIQKKFGKLDHNQNKTEKNTPGNLTYISEEPGGSDLYDTDESGNTLVRSASDNSISKETDVDAYVGCKSASAECISNSLNYSVGSSSDRESIKTTKSDTCSNCSVPSSQHNSTQEFPRSASSCSGTCANSLPLENALSLQFGCMKCLNPGVQLNPNAMNLLQTGGPAYPCSYVCTQHAVKPIGASYPLQSVIRNTLSGPLLLSGTSASYIEIQAPSELYFPEKIAIGDSQEMTLPIRNSANIACYYIISCVSAYLNDSPLPFEMAGLSYNKSTIPCSVESVTDVKLILAPKYEGKIEVNLQIDAFVSSVGQAMNTVLGASIKTKVQFEVIRPSVSILHKGKSTFNVGTVIAGSTFVEHVTIINNCEVPVPLRISLSNDSHKNEIYFGLKEIDRQKHPTTGGLKFLSSKLLLYRIPASKNKQLPSSLNIPVVFESINTPVNSSITAAVETPTLSEVLAFMKISAGVGYSKLVLTDTNQNSLELKAFKGATYSHSVRVMNDGNLPVVYDIHIEGDNDVLSVFPNSLSLESKECANISVTFTPQTYNIVKGNLLAAAEPHGQVFKIAEITGHVKENCFMKPPRLSKSEIVSIKPTKDVADYTIEGSNLIECDKKYLCWGGSDIGSAVFKTFTARNPTKENLQVKIFLKQKSQGFMLIDDSNKKTTAFTLMLKANEEKLLSVVFMPSDVASYSGLLCIKSVTQNESKVFRITLSGYGGTSNIKVLGLPTGEKTDYFLNVHEPTEADVCKNIIFHNCGVRPAFLKLLVAFDILLENTAAKQSVIEPSEFVLLENEKKNVSISMNLLNKSSCEEIITALYGDEILRQRLKAKIKSMGSSRGDSPYVNFNIPYDGEEKVPFDSSYQPSSNDESFLYNNLKKIQIQVLFSGQNRSFSRLSFGALSEIQESFADMTLNSTILSNCSGTARPKSIEGHSPPVKETTSRLSSPNLLNNNAVFQPTSTDSGLLSIADGMERLIIDTWAVIPKEIVISADMKEKRILLKNYANLDMRFNVHCTIDVIMLSPVSGILSANGEIELKVTVINTNYNKLLKDYCGTINILCNGTMKIVSVTVLKDTEKTSTSVPEILNETLRSEFLGNSEFLESTVVETTESLSVENVCNFPKEVVLPVTKQYVLSETVLIVSNPTNSAVTWNIHPMSMLFTKPCDNSADYTSSAIEFPVANGILRPMSTENIVIKFLPQSVAHFQQFFELVLAFESGANQRSTVKVLGEAVADLSSTLKSSNVKSKRKQSDVIKKRVTSEIFTVSDICKFPATISGQKSTEVIIVRNISSHDIKFAIVQPELPFILKFPICTVKSKRQVKIPVYFKPLKPGNYESEVRLICDTAKELEVTLNGVCLA